MRTTSICLLTIAALLSSQVARADQSQDAFVWFTSHVCNTKFEAGSPGSSPELAIIPEDFGEVSERALEAIDPPKGEAATASRYECKWVQLTGFFAWGNYYHYRGKLYESAWEAYRKPRVSYFVERFADAATRRAGLAQRKVTLVGRFYDLCAAARRAEQESDKRWLMVFGPCHYGADKGMMLTDVRVKQVHDNAPRYILGEGNRNFFGELFPVEGNERAALTERVRAWAASVKRGPAAYVSELLANPYWAKQEEEQRQEQRDRVLHPDGYIAFLNDDQRFKRLNPARASVAVFWDGPYEVESKREAWGCICLKDECADRWPLFSRDAENFFGDAACTWLQKSDVSGQWLWR